MARRATRWVGGLAALAALATLLGCGGGSPFEDACHDLRKGGRKVRERAAMDLYRYGARAVPPLVGALDDPSASVVFAAIMSLTELGPRAAPAVGKLVFHVTAGPEDVRMAALEALVQIAPRDPRSITVFFWTLGSPDDDLRIALERLLERP